MSKIKWENRADIDSKKALQEQEKTEKKKFKGKEFKTLSIKEKDALLEILLKEHDLI